MKAVIMAGGKGTRLRPLTAHTPKPMVPLLNRPCLEYMLNLLKKHGITEIAITLQYLPEVIKSYFGDGSAFGVSLTYFEETAPLGTAGSVKNCQEFLDQRFLVISGDALTDIDLSAAIAFHQEKGSLATLVLTRVEDPLEFGVVMTDETGRITRFLEKPNWSEVFSDTVNTGIYILEPQTLPFISTETEIDFGKDLFPRFLEKEKPLYGYIAEGYWSDIGTMEIYRQAQFDMLEGKVEIEIKAEEIAPRIYLEPGVRIESSVRLEGPAYIGEKAHLQNGVKVGAYSIVGSHSILSPGSKIAQTILWENVFLANRAELNGVTVCRSVQIGESALISEGAVIGEHCRLGSKVFIKHDVKVWPHKEVAENTTVHTSLIYGGKLAKSLFGDQGVRGAANIDVTPEFVTRLAAAYAFLLRGGSRIALSACTHPFAQLLKHSMMTSLCSSGIDTVDFGVGLSPITRYGVRKFAYQGAVHLHMSETSEEKNIVIQFFDQHGLPVSRDFERKLENAYWQETYVRSLTENLGQLHVEHHVQQSYLQALLVDVDLAKMKRRRFRLLIECEQRYLPAFLTPLMQTLGVRVVYGTVQEDMPLQPIDFGISLDKNGEHFSLYTENGAELSQEQLLALQLVACFNGTARIGLPVSAPMELESLARLINVEVVRTKVTPRAMMEVSTHDLFHPLFDAIHSMVKILEYLAGEEKPLSQLITQLPSCHMERKTVFCPKSSKGKVMRRMMEENKGKPLELVDGIKVYDTHGWVLILPDSQEACVKVISQGSSAESASTLAADYAQRITEWQ